MSEIAIIALLFAAGLLVLVAELFLPSHGVLGVLGAGLMIAGVVQTYRFGGERAGTVAGLTCLAALPAFAVAAVKIWPKTWIGRRIVPPNPVATHRDTSVPVDELSRYIGKTGRATSPLRPVGVCEFDGRRISCIAEFGMLDAGAKVEGTRVISGQLAVQETQFS